MTRPIPNRAIVLDSGALIGVERRSARMQELLTQARSHRAALVVPTAVVAQVIREGGRQANLRRLLADSYVRFVSLDYALALEIGALLGRSGSVDVVDASVVMCSRRLNSCPVVTSDPDDIRALDPELPLVVI